MVRVQTGERLHATTFTAQTEEMANVNVARFAENARYRAAVTSWRSRLRCFISKMMSPLAILGRKCEKLEAVFV